MTSETARNERNPMVTRSSEPRSRACERATGVSRPGEPSTNVDQILPLQAVPSRTIASGLTGPTWPLRRSPRHLPRL